MTAIVRYVTGLRTGSLPARFYFLALIFGFLIPVFLLAGWLSKRSAQSEALQIEQNVQQQTGEIAAVLDHELAAFKSTLTALKASHFLQVGDIDAFYQQASEVSQDLKVRIVLFDPARHAPIANTSLQPAAGSQSGPGLPREVEDELAHSSGPVVSNLLYDPLTRQPLIYVIVPLTTLDGRSYWLGLAASARRVATVINQTRLPPGGIISIIDRHGTFIARSVRQDEVVGRSVAPEGLIHAADAPNEFRGKNLEGDAFYWVNRRSDVSGFVVIAGVPVGIVDAPINLFWRLAPVAAALLALALVAAHFGSNQISTAFAALRTAVGGLAGSGHIAPPKTGIKEADDLSRALVAHHATRQLVDGRRQFAIDTARVGSWLRDLRTGERFLSRQFKILVGMPDDVDPCLENYLRCVHPDHRLTVRMNADRIRADGDPVDLEYLVVGYHNQLWRWVESKVALVHDCDGLPTAVQGIVQDITPRKMAERERDELRNRLQQASEEARRRLGRELHDETGQTLTAALLELKALEQGVETAGHLHLKRLRQLLEDMGKTLHRVSSDLRPVALDELGFYQSLRHYLSEWREQYRICVDFNADEANLRGFSDELEITLYRVVQEALTNIAKHAGAATIVSVIIKRSDSVVQLTIEDNGSGFDVSKLNQPGPHSGLGVAGMRERVVLVHGEFDIESSPGIGTTIFVRVPVTPKATAT